MAFKKRNKVSAEFSMSSLTDIIFLLLIFFMLTSTVVAPNALNLKMPGRSDTPAQPSTKNLDDVRISNDGSFYLNNKRIDVSALESKLAAKAGSRSKLTVLISPDKKAPVEGVVTIMDMARRLNIDGVLAASE